MSVANLTVDFPSFLKYALPVAMEGYPVMLRGPHGIGKSEGVYQLSRDVIGWDPKKEKCVPWVAKKGLIPYEVVERRVSQMTEGDLLGIPDPEGFNINGETATKFRPFSWLVKACTQPVILFLDELDRGISEVRQGFFELADSRKIAGWELHPGTLIFSAINGGGEDAHRYQVNELGLAEADRWSTYDLKPSVEDWLNWGKITDSEGKQNIDPLVLEFIQTNEQHLEHNGEIEPGKKYPSRRSWKRLTDCLVSQGLLEEGAKNAPRAVRFIGDSFVGIEAANSFSDFVENYQFQVSPDDIINKGKWKKTEGFSLNQDLALADKIERSGLLEKKMTKKQMMNFCRWFVRVPAEVGMKMFNALSNGPNDNTIDLHGTCVDGQNMSDYLCILLTGVDAEH